MPSLSTPSSPTIKTPAAATVATAVATTTHPLLKQRSEIDLDAAPRTARLRYYAGIATVALLLLSATIGGSVIRIPLALPVLAALYTFGPLRINHAHHVRAAQRGCHSPPRYPGEGPWGIRYLLETASLLKTHGMLQRRRETLEALGHTYVHGLFPDWTECITTDEPEIVKAVLSTSFADWALPSIRIKSFLPILGTHSIFTTNGAEWQHSRAILRPAFVRDQISDLACVDHHVRRFIDRISPATATKDEVIDLQALFSMLTTDTISDFMFGQSTDLLGDAPAESHLFGRYFDASMHKIAWRARLGWLTLLRRDPELDKYATFMRDFVRRFVRDVRGNAEANTHREDAKKYVFLDELLKSGESDDVICDHLLSIFTAGRDTTTSVLTYLFFELSRRPNVISLIRSEIAEAQTSSPSDTPTWETLRNMKYLNWTIKEALRLNPPVASNQREAVRDTVIPRGGGPGGDHPVFVPAGTQLRYLTWSMQRRRDLFGEDADVFRPERWADLRVIYEYLPFNAGPRICIGQQFALAQMALITFRLLQAFATIERRDERPPIQKLGINLSMLHGCLVSVTRA